MPSPLMPAPVGFGDTREPPKTLAGLDGLEALEGFAPDDEAPEQALRTSVSRRALEEPLLVVDEQVADVTMERRLPRHTLPTGAPLSRRDAFELDHDPLDAGDPLDPPTAELTPPMLQRRATPAPLLDVAAAAAAGLATGPFASPPVPPEVYFDEFAGIPAALPRSADFASDALGSDTLGADDDANPFDFVSEKTADLDLPKLRLRAAALEAALDKSQTDDGETMEGGPIVEEGTEVGPPPPEPGQVLDGRDGARVKLEDSLGEQSSMVFFRARVLGDDLPYTAVWSPLLMPEPPWERLPDPRIVRPRARVDLEKACVRVFERPKGNTVVDYLGDDERLLPAMATLELGIELAEILEGLHGAGQLIYDLDPSQIVIERGGRVRLYAVNGLFANGTTPPGQLGVFCAPEVRRRMTYLMGAHSDVYAVSLLLYALLARRAPLESDLDPNFLQSPRVFRPECPLGVWPYLRPCLEAQPNKRVGHARALRQLLERARARLLLEAHAAEAQTPVSLEAWAELHTGITKARRGSGQQDRALSLTDDSGGVGFYLISDGVSRSRYGDGAFAAEQVALSALQRWTAMEKGGPAALELKHEHRGEVLKQIVRSAGKRISTEVNARYAPLANEPNQVMSATLVCAFVVKGEATLGNLGDSRAYLIRDGTIEQITIDHDRCTDALRMGLTFKEAAGVQMASALTRVVGRVIVDDDGSTRPDPFEPELFRLRLLPGDRLLLCSDGVADFVAGPGAALADIEKTLLQTVSEHDDPARAAFELVVLANRAGGYDNISCVVLAAHPLVA